MVALGSSSGVSDFFDAAGEFFKQLGGLSWVPLLIALASYAVYLLLRARAIHAALVAAFPSERFQFRRVWGAYMAAYGINNLLPAGGGNVLQLVLTRNSIPTATYPTVGAAIATATVFDTAINVPVVGYCFTQGVFPKPPDLSKISAFDIGFWAAHLHFTLFFITLLGVAFVLGYVLLAERVEQLWRHLRQGLTILSNRRRYLRQMASLQLASWIFKGAAFWLLLDAFHIGGDLRRTVLVLGVQGLAAIFPFTPGGAGVQQALLVAVFGGSAGVAAFSVGQQVALAALTLGLGFAALTLIFGLRSFKGALRHARAARAQGEPAL
ncbi:MAG: lysylphosphatidylglycerol synthase transmembrane domain-containing protein [Solirubrobacteraceae bacterium]|nr:MAG: hypothetical protein DLM63_05390 [Solirubrobacterales bacterium]